MTSQSGGLKKPEKGPTPPIKIEVRVGIQASSEVIWELLSDLSSWSRWSAIYPGAAGTLRIGASLDITEALPGLPERSYHPRVIDWVPYEQILWADGPWRGWVNTIRYLEIEELDKSACIVSNGLQVGGFLGDLYAERRRSAIKKGYHAFNEGLKAAAEALWKDRA
jgi:hypothetical protein